LKIEFPALILSDLHVGHPASPITDPNGLRPLFEGVSTVIFNGDTVELLWLCNRENAQEQLDGLANACLRAGARPVFLNGNHDPVISSASHLDLCDGAVLVTHGDILFHEIAPWSREAKLVGPEHSRTLRKLSAEAHSDFEERLVACKRASLALELHEPRSSGRRLARTALVVREAWPPWRVLQILRYWMQVPGQAARLAEEFRPQAQFVILGHSHRAGMWKRGPRVIINTGSFMPLAAIRAVRLESDHLEFQRVLRRNQEWAPGGPVVALDLPQE
jgi:UDP-2,3-diacylglucosamine pyrophosphatase LpxH